MKLKIAHLLILACLSVPLFAQQIIDSKQKEIVVRNVNVIPMDKEQVLANQTVVIRDGKVQAMGKNISFPDLLKCTRTFLRLTTSNR